MITAKRVDIRYATALFQTAKEQGLDGIVYNDMVELRVLAVNNCDFRNFLKNPVIKSSQKAHIFHKLFDGVFHKLTLDFLMLILKKLRLNNIQGITTAYVQLYRKEHHLKTVTIFTEKELLDIQKQNLLTVLSEQMPDQAVDLRCRIRSEIIGGFVLRYGDFLYDGSVATQLKNMRQKFESNLHKSQL